MANRAHDFRYIFSDVLGFRMSDNSCQIVFGIDEGGGPESALEQVGIALTLRTAKILAVTVTEFLSDYEAKTGNLVPFDLEKLDSLRELMKGANFSAIASEQPS